MSVVDTNILVHVTDPSPPEQASAARAVSAPADAGPVAITRQTMREYLAVMTRPQTNRPALPDRDAMEALLQVSRQFRVQEGGEAIWTEFERLDRTVRFGGKQVHDANLVGTMLAHGGRRVLTCNTTDFVRFSPFIEVLSP